MSDQANLQLEDRIFCLSYELNLLSSQVFGQGWNGGLKASHRRQFTANMCKGTNTHAGLRWGSVSWISHAAPGAAPGCWPTSEAPTRFWESISRAMPFAMQAFATRTRALSMRRRTRWSGRGPRISSRRVFRNDRAPPCPDRFLKNLASFIKQAARSSSPHRCGEERR